MPTYGVIDRVFSYLRGYRPSIFIQNITKDARPPERVEKEKKKKRRKKRRREDKRDNEEEEKEKKKKRR